MRAAAFEGMKATLKRGGLLILQGYRPKQLEYKTGGPSIVENLYTAEILRNAFGDLRILHLLEHDSEVSEGAGHRGLSALIDLVADRLGLATLPAERSFDSVAGFLLWQLERFPEEGESLQFEGYQFEVIDMDGPRIDKVLATRVIDPTAPDDELAGG